MQQRIQIWCLGLGIAWLVAACAVNPVTGRQELHLVSETAEINVGKENYAPAQQSQGGEFTVDPALTTYVGAVGRRLAQASDRPTLPYEFVVVNNSVPNAWALPGGKIALNRGLLAELHDEAELAAVLSHEIVHAAARHGAQSMERGLLAQIGLLGLGLAVSDSKYGQYSDLLVGAASVGVALIQTGYSREAELEADYYGMRYMARAGYDPRAAVPLQETFVRLSQDRKENWLSGLFSTHPPSPERVAANVQTAAALPAGGEVGREAYQKNTAFLRKLKPAYAELDAGRKALADKDAARALAAAAAAIRVEPREALFYGLRGDAHVQQALYREALADYDEAIRRNPQYFQFYLQRGLVRQHLGDAQGARGDLARSATLFPTALAHYALGNIARQGGRDSEALEHFRVAAGSSSAVGREARAELAKLELPQHPERYIAVSVSRDRGGYVAVNVRNASGVGVRGVTVAVTYRDERGRAAGRESVYIAERLGPGAATSRATRIGPLADKKDLRRVTVRVTDARLAN